MMKIEILRRESVEYRFGITPQLLEARRMLNHQSDVRSSPPGSLRQRFLSSSSGALAQLKQLLIDSPSPIEPNTGAQIAQMLRAIREGASTHALDRIARIAANIEIYLTSSEAYGPGGELRNFVLGTKIEELQKRFEQATTE
jgi:hypothetical protein